MEVSTVHETLRGWVEDLASDGYSVRLAHAFDTPDDNTLIVSAVAVAISADPLRLATRNRHTPPRKPLARMRYLLAVSSSEGGIEAQQVLLEILRRAQAAPGFSIAADSPSPDWWLACGIKPRPAFILEASLSEKVRNTEAPMVREHDLALSPMIKLHGRVVASDGTPLAFAEVRIVSSGHNVRCNNNGEFRIDMDAPEPNPSPRWVRVRARGTESRFRIPAGKNENQPWLLRMEQL